MGDCDECILVINCISYVGTPLSDQTGDIGLWPSLASRFRGLESSFDTPSIFRGGIAVGAEHQLTRSAHETMMTRPASRGQATALSTHAEFKSARQREEKGEA